MAKSSKTDQDDDDSEHSLDMSVLIDESVRSRTRNSPRSSPVASPVHSPTGRFRTPPPQRTRDQDKSDFKKKMSKSMSPAPVSARRVISNRGTAKTIKMPLRLPSKSDRRGKMRMDGSLSLSDRSLRGPTEKLKDDFKNLLDESFSLRKDDDDPTPVKATAAAAPLARPKAITSTDRNYSSSGLTIVDVVDHEDESGLPPSLAAIPRRTKKQRDMKRNKTMPEGEAQKEESDVKARLVKKTKKKARRTSSLTSPLRPNLVDDKYGTKVRKVRSSSEAKSRSVSPTSKHSKSNQSSPSVSPLASPKTSPKTSKPKILRSFMSSPKSREKTPSPKTSKSKKTNYAKIFSKSMTSFSNSKSSMFMRDMGDLSFPDLVQTDSKDRKEKKERGLRRAMTMPDKPEAPVPDKKKDKKEKKERGLRRSKTLDEAPTSSSKRQPVQLEEEPGGSWNFRRSSYGADERKKKKKEKEAKKSERRSSTGVSPTTMRRMSSSFSKFEDLKNKKFKGNKITKAAYKEELKAAKEEIKAAKKAAKKKAKSEAAAATATDDSPAVDAPKKEKKPRLEKIVRSKSQESKRQQLRRASSDLAKYVWSSSRQLTDKAIKGAVKVKKPKSSKDKSDGEASPKREKTKLKKSKTMDGRSLSPAPPLVVSVPSNEDLDKKKPKVSEKTEETKPSEGAAGLKSIMEQYKLAFPRSKGPTINFDAAFKEKSDNLIKVILSAQSAGQQIAGAEEDTNTSKQEEEEEEDPNDFMVQAMRMASPVPFLCPISENIMKDPVTTSSGSTYERKVIQWWLKKSDLDPLTQKPIANKALTPNTELKESIENWKEDFKTKMCPDMEFSAPADKSNMVTKDPAKTPVVEAKSASSGKTQVATKETEAPVAAAVTQSSPDEEMDAVKKEPGSDAAMTLAEEAQSAPTDEEGVVMKKPGSDVAMTSTVDAQFPPTQQTDVVMKEPESDVSPATKSPPADQVDVVMKEPEGKPQPAESKKTDAEGDVAFATVEHDEPAVVKETPDTAKQTVIDTTARASPDKADDVIPVSDEAIVKATKEDSSGSDQHGSLRKMFVGENRKKLTKAFKIQQDRDGNVTSRQWASVVGRELKLKDVDWLELQPELAPALPNGKIDWMAFLSRQESLIPPESASEDSATIQMESTESKPEAKGASSEGLSSEADVAIQDVEMELQMQDWKPDAPPPLPVNVEEPKEPEELDVPMDTGAIDAILENLKRASAVCLELPADLDEPMGEPEGEKTTSTSLPQKAEEDQAEAKELNDHSEVSESMHSLPGYDWTTSVPALGETSVTMEPEPMEEAPEYDWKAASPKRKSKEKANAAGFAAVPFWSDLAAKQSQDSAAKPAEKGSAAPPESKQSVTLKDIRSPQTKKKEATIYKMSQSTSALMDIVHWNDSDSDSDSDSESSSDDETTIAKAPPPAPPQKKPNQTKAHRKSIFDSDSDSDSDSDDSSDEDSVERKQTSLSMLSVDSKKSMGLSDLGTPSGSLISSSDEESEDMDEGKGYGSMPDIDASGQSHVGTLPSFRARKRLTIKPTHASLSALDYVQFTPQNFVQQREERFDDYYKLGALLGEGEFGEVFIGYQKQGSGLGEERAIKIIDKHRMCGGDYEQVINEFNLLRGLTHPNLLTLYGFYEDDSNCYIVTDLCTGGELWDELDARGNFEEADAAEFMTNLLSAVKFLQSHKIVHRDINLENILLEGNKELDQMKIIDFGLATKYEDGVKLTELVGKVHYVAPEVLNQCYEGSKYDVWSSGVVAFILLSGYAPFEGENDALVMEQVTLGLRDANFNDPAWDNISDEAKDFCRHLLTYEEDSRPTAEQALKHAWIQNSIKKNSESFMQTYGDSSIACFENMQDFVSDVSLLKLKQAVYTFIASQLLLKEEREEIDRVFRGMDNDCDGKLSKPDIKIGYKRFFNKELSDEETDKMFDRINTSKTGLIDYTEFVIAAMQKSKILDTEKLKAAFSSFDRGDKGFISANDLKLALEGVIALPLDNEGGLDADGIIKEMISQVDVEGDGKISYDNFEDMMMAEVIHPDAPDEMDTTPEEPPENPPDDCPPPPTLFGRQSSLDYNFATASFIGAAKPPSSFLAEVGPLVEED